LSSEKKNQQSFPFSLESEISVLKLSALIAGVYAFLSLIYIKYSGDIAAKISINTDDLKFIEQIKGYIFVVVTGLLLFVLCFVVLKKIKSLATEIDKKNIQLMKSEKAIVAAMVTKALRHDFNNFLQTAVAKIDLLAFELGKDKKEELNKVSNELADFAKALSVGKSQNENMEFLLSEALQEQVALISRHPEVTNARLLVEIEPGIKIRGNYFLFKRMVANLVLNAAEICSKDCSIAVSLKRSGSEIILEIEDNGPGIQAEDKNDILKPLYTTRENGTGMGLVSLKAFVQSQNARIEIEKSNKLGGAMFRIIMNSEKASGLSEKQEDI
jgi:signal transduction histidine kinase